MKRRLTISRRNRAGFTLLELVTVMAILVVISAAITPVYLATMDGVRTRNARSDLVAVLRYAQEVAVRESREHRVYFNKDTNSYRLMRLSGLDNNDKVFEVADSLLGEGQALPENLILDNIRARRDKNTREYFVSCLPNGASDNAVINLRDERFRNVQVSITVEGPLGKITVEESR